MSKGYTKRFRKDAMIGKPLRQEVTILNKPDREEIAKKAMEMLNDMAYVEKVIDTGSEYLQTVFRIKIAHEHRFSS